MPKGTYTSRQNKLRGERLVAGNPQKYKAWQQTQQGFFADTTHHGVKRTDGKKSRRLARRTGYSTRQWKKGRVLGAIGATGAAVGAGIHMATRKPKQQQPQLPGYAPVGKAYVKPESRDGYDRKDVRFKDERYDRIEANRLKRIYPQLLAADTAATLGPAVGAAGGIDAGVKAMNQRSRRGEVHAQSREGAGPGGIGGHVGMRRRSMVRSASARAGQEESPIRVVRRSEKERSRERAAATVKPLAAGGAATAGFLALRDPRIRDRVETFARQARNVAEDTKEQIPENMKGRALGPLKWARGTKTAQMAEKHGKRVARAAYKHPGKAAALSAAAGLGAAAYGNKREPDTHKIEFVHPRTRDKAKK